MTETNEEEKSILEDENEEQISEDSLGVPYDFRAEYKERITTTVPETQEMDKRFSSVRWHAIGISILIGVLIAVLITVFFWDGRDENSSQPLMISGNDEPFKERPIEPGGMNIPDQDKLVYKRMRTDDMDTKVEKLFYEEELPVEPPTPAISSTQEGQILGNPIFVPETSEDIELEVISVKDKGLKMDIPEQEPKVDSTPSKTENKKITKPTSKKLEDKNIFWYVQLISLPSKAGAEKAWPKILKEHSVLLSGLPYDVKSTQIKGKGTFYRLRVGKFETKEKAQTLCAKLKARKQDCSLTK